MYLLTGIQVHVMLVCYACLCNWLTLHNVVLFIGIISYGLAKGFVCVDWPFGTVLSKILLMFYFVHNINRLFLLTNNGPYVSKMFSHTQGQYRHDQSRISTGH